MNSAIIVMTILGCGQGEAACDFVRTVDTPFSSRAECEAQAGRELMRTGSVNYPDVIAVCEPLEAATARSGVPGAPLAAPAPVGEPKVVAMPEDLRPKNPLRSTFDKTREAIGKAKRATVSLWRGITGRDEEPQTPVRLGRFAPGER